MKWQERTLSEVLAARKATRCCKVLPDRPSRVRAEEEAHVEGFLRRGELGSEERAEAVRYLERKCRVSFAEAFSRENFEWRVASPHPLLLEQQHDAGSRSYYLFAGRIAVLPRRDSAHITELSPPEAVALEAEVGIGWLFGQQSFGRAEITLLSGIALQISHPPPSERLIERGCLMNLREKQQAVGRLRLFSAIENLSKTHLPHFLPRKFVKGESIYAIGDPPAHLYLVVDGEVAFESSLPAQQESSALRRAFPRREAVATTETIGRNNYFGEEEVLASTRRVQNAKCASIECLLLMVPVGRLEKLMACLEFRRALELSAALKQEAREHQISTVLSRTRKQEEASPPSALDAERFGQLKSAIYSHLCAAEERPFRSRIGKERRKVVHNLALTEAVGEAARVSGFSMLDVNRAMYDKTLMRFRYQLKEIERSAQGRPPAEANRARSLQDIWRTLRLERSFNPEEERLRLLGEQDGMASYLAHQRKARHIRETKCMRPKSLHCTNKIKSEYIEYLQMAL